MNELNRDLASLRLDDAASTRPRRWPLALVVVAVLLGAGWFWNRASAPPEVEVSRAVVQTNTSTQGGAPLLTASGYVVARRKAVVSAKIQGRLAELRVEEGSRVREGELIARLESFDYEAQLARSRAQVESVRAQVGTYDARVTRANADLSEYQRQWRLADRLATEQVGSVDARDAARSRVSQAEAAVAEARAARAQVDAQLAQAQAEVRVAEAVLQNTFIKAPFAGVVVKKMAEVGESVAPIPPGVNISTASGAIVAMADMDTLEAEFDIGESNVAKLGADQPAEIVVEAFPAKTFRAALRQVIPTADRTKATVMVKVAILDKDELLKPEMSARVTFLERAAAATPTSAPIATVMAPQSAIVSRDGRNVVFEVTGGNVVRLRPVETGLAQGGQAVIKQGLAGTETLVRRPADSLKDGDPIRIKQD